MRRRELMWSTVVIAGSFVAGCADDEPLGKGGGKNGSGSGSGSGDGLDGTLDGATPGDGNASDVDAQELAGLEFMRQEEKLARDVYLTFGELYDVRVFENIASSEQVHMDAILTLLEYYGFDDPVAGYAIGKFENADLQKLYDELIATGSQSLEAALRAAALIEEIDILDLRERSGITDDQIIKDVYADLENGSYNHLRAFVNQLDKVGVAYAPEKLTQDDYAAILASAQEKGGHG